jgi:hypothetical protein
MIYQGSWWKSKWGDQKNKIEKEGGIAVCSLLELFELAI